MQNTKMGANSSKDIVSEWAHMWSCILEHELGLFYMGGAGDWLDPDKFQGLACDGEIAHSADFESYCPEGSVFTSYAPPLDGDEGMRTVIVVLDGNPEIYRKWLKKLSRRKLLVIVPPDRFAEAYVCLNNYDLCLVTYVGGTLLAFGDSQAGVESSRLEELQDAWEKFAPSQTATKPEERS